MKRKTSRDSGPARIVFLFDVEARHPAEHYFIVDDKLRILAAIKKLWGLRVTTVFVKQGHYALDPKILATYPAADASLDRIGDLLDHDLARFTPRAAKVASDISIS